MAFSIEGEGEFSPTLLPKSVRSAIDLLQSFPDGKLLRMQTLAERVSIAKATFDAHSSHPALAEFKFRSKNRIVYFGNPRTIAAAKERFSL